MKNITINIAVGLLLSLPCFANVEVLNVSPSAFVASQKDGCKITMVRYPLNKGAFGGGVVAHVLCGRDENLVVFTGDERPIGFKLSPGQTLFLSYDRFNGTYSEVVVR